LPAWQDSYQFQSAQHKLEKERLAFVVPFFCDPRPFSPSNAMARIGTGQLAKFCHRVGTSLQAGVDVLRIWGSEAHRGSPRHRREMEMLRERIVGGESLAAAFTQTGGYFPPLVCEMIDVGERTGRIDEVFLRLADHYDHIVRLRRDFLFGIAWPMFELTVAVLVIGILIWALGMLGTGIAVFGLSGTKGMLLWFGFVGLIIAAFLGVGLAIRHGWINPEPVFRALMNLPGIGLVLRTMAMARLTWSLAIATDSDLRAEKAVSLAVRSTENSYYTSQLDTMFHALRHGKPIHTAFRETRIYPDDFLDTLETGELAGTISESMHHLAKDYENRAKALYRTMGVVAGVVIFLLIAGIMIFFIFKLFTSLYLGPINDVLDTM